MTKKIDFEYAMFMYYSYHGKAQKLIKEGHLVRYEFVEVYKSISPCLLLFFDNHIPMPIRQHRFEEYLSLFDSLGILPKEEVGIFEE